MQTIAKGLLAINAVWDIACATAILLDLLTGHRCGLSEIHVGMLVNKEPEPAVRLLLMSFILNEAFLRATAAYLDMPWLAAWSYMGEAFLMFMGIVIDGVDPVQGWGCIAMCGIMWRLIVA